MQTLLNTLVGQFGFSHRELAEFAGGDRTSITHALSGRRELPAATLVPLLLLYRFALDVGLPPMGESADISLPGWAWRPRLKLVGLRTRPKARQRGPSPARLQQQIRLCQNRLLLMNRLRLERLPLPQQAWMNRVEALARQQWASLEAAWRISQGR